MHKWIYSLLVLLSGCGYQFGNYLDKYRTISIPYVMGDEKGIVTQALVREIATRTSLRYLSSQGDLVLNVALVEQDSDNIGFRFAPPEVVDGVSKVIVAEEGRLFLKAHVTLIDRKRGCTLFGPLEVSYVLTYDFEPDFTNVNFHAFSLGQLEMRPIAEEATERSLDALLASKIVDVLLLQ